jgi:hypothetical protein
LVFISIYFTYTSTVDRWNHNINTNYQKCRILYCNGFDQSVARQQICKHDPTCNSRCGVFSMSPAPTSDGTTGLCNPFLSNGSVNTFPHIGPCYKSSEVIKIETVFSVGSVQGAYNRREDRIRSGQLQVSRKLEEWVQKNF